MCGKYGGALSDRPVCILGEAFSRQAHIRTPQGGVMADHMIAMVVDQYMELISDGPSDLIFRRLRMLRWSYMRTN